MHEAVNLQHASSARILSTSPSTRSSTHLALGVLHGDGLHSGSTAVRQWRQKRVLMRPEAAFPYVFAAEGAQHPPKSRHAERTAAKTFRRRGNTIIPRDRADKDGGEP